METIEQRLKFAAMVLKFVAFCDLVLEVAIFIYEVFRIQNYERMNVEVRFTEEKKRTAYSLRVLIQAMTFIPLLIAVVVGLYCFLPDRSCWAK